MKSSRDGEVGGRGSWKECLSLVTIDDEGLGKGGCLHWSFQFCDAVICERSMCFRNLYDSIKLFEQY